MIDTISKVWPRKGNGPGAVVFSSGEKLTTFDEEVLATAAANIGQQAEYTTVRKGQYTNLGNLKPTGNIQQPAPLSQSAPQYIPPAAQPPAIDLETRKAPGRIADALERIATALENARSAVLTVAPAGGTGGSTEPERDPIAASQEQLAAKVGPDAADAMFSALRKKHGKSPEKLTAAVAELLKAHGIEAVS